MASDLQIIESFSNPDILLYCPSTTAILGTMAEHKPNGDYVQVWGPVVLLPHMKSFHGSSVLVYSVLESWG